MNKESSLPKISEVTASLSLSLSLSLPLSLSLSHIPIMTLYWLVLCQLDTAGVITDKGASVAEMPP
jgi:hypothetical protein